MGGWAYAAGRRHCDPLEQLKREWIAAMTGRRGHRGHAGQHWAMFGGPGANWGAGPWGPGGPWAPRGPKARRGDVRAAILAVLAEQPMNGYQLIQEIAERSGGVWKPSPGSVYPTLQQLEDEGLVRADAETGRRTFRLTDEGKAYVSEHAEEVASPWEAFTATGDDDSGLKPMLGQVGTALWQILAAGSPDQQTRARKALADLRRTLYDILADDDKDRDRS